MMEVMSVDMLFSSSTCHIPRSRSDYYCEVLDDTLYFKEGLENSEGDQRAARPNIDARAYLKIVNLPCDNQEKHDALNDRPPLDTRIRRLGCVPVSPFSNQDILLLVFYRFKVICECTNFSLDRGNNIYIGWLERGEASQREKPLAILANVYHTMDVKAARLVRDAFIRSSKSDTPDDLVRNRAHEI